MHQTNRTARAAARLAEIDAKLAALQAEKRQLDARRIADDRASRTRQNVIVGAWIAKHEPETFERVRNSLVRAQDRKAFGLALLAGEGAEALPSDQDS